MVGEYKIRKVLKEGAVAYFEVMSHKLSGGTEENQE
jgi:hypothetical protein